MYLSWVQKGSVQLIVENGSRLEPHIYIYRGTQKKLSPLPPIESDGIPPSTLLYVLRMRGTRSGVSITIILSKNCVRCLCAQWPDTSNGWG